MARFQLSDEQRAVVEHPADGGNLLVLAAPGSGKTRVIVERIDWLIRQGVPPERILAMTFTRRAAGELRGRLRTPGVWAGTFHSISADILFDNHREAGYREAPRIYDEVRQREALKRAILGAGLPLPDDAEAAKWLIDSLAQWISVSKRAGGAQPFVSEGFSADMAQEAREAYDAELKEAEALDFDDIVIEAGRLLREHGEIAERYRNRVSWLFIDEYHDVSPEQLGLTTLLAPPGLGQCTVLAVADPDQAIYGWRGADSRAIDRYRTWYRPTVRTLSRNYRSSTQIVEAANRVLEDARRSAVATAGMAAGPVRCRQCPDERAEARIVADLVGTLLDEGQVRPGEIGILYRTHRRGDLVEGALQAADIPVLRVEQGRFFAQPDVREAMRYLDLALDLADEGFVGALNWPRMAVDELTMVSLRRDAEKAGRSLCDQARAVAAGSVAATPLTREAIRDLLTTVDGELAARSDDPADAVIARLLPILDARRHPILAGDRTTLLGAQDFLAPRLASCAGQIKAAVDERRRVFLLHDGTPDAVAGAVILEHVLGAYFEHPVTMGSDPDFGSDGGLSVALGSVAASIGFGFALDVMELRQYAYSISMQAWRIGQMVLMAYESVDQDEFAMFDIETGSNHPALAEIIDVAVQVVRAGAPVDAGFESLVRPSGPAAITEGASRVNGLEWRDVEHAPSAAEALEALLDAIGGRTVVGHNIEQFDYPVLQRAATRAGLPEPNHHLLDTYPLAVRLFPDARDHKLQTLMRRLTPDVPQVHRALPDARMNGEVFWMLLAELRRQRELDCLSEVLPLVTLGIVSSPVPRTDENATLLQAGECGYSWGQGHLLVDRWAEVLGERGERGRDWLARRQVAKTEDDDRWDRRRESWLRQVAVFMDTSADRSIRAFLHRAALIEPGDHVPTVELPPDDEGNPDPRGASAIDRVAMMTVHSAKGLEWPVVILVGVEDGQFPAFFSKDHDEERRLLYVGMTRAGKRLEMVWVGRYKGHRKSLTAFLASIPSGIVEFA